MHVYAWMKKEEVDITFRQIVDGSGMKSQRRMFKEGNWSEFLNKDPSKYPKTGGRNPSRVLPSKLGCLQGQQVKLLLFSETKSYLQGEAIIVLKIF